MSEEEKEKAKTITLKVTIPTKSDIIEGFKQMFPLLTVEVEEESEEEPSEPTN